MEPPAPCSPPARAQSTHARPYLLGGAPLLEEQEWVRLPGAAALGGRQFPEVCERCPACRCEGVQLGGEGKASTVIRGCPGRKLVICNESLTYLK